MLKEFREILEGDDGDGRIVYESSQIPSFKHLEKLRHENLT